MLRAAYLTWVRCKEKQEFSPEGVKFNSPGQRPGETGGHRISEPRRGETRFVSPLRGLKVGWSYTLGALRRAIEFHPFGAFLCRAHVIYFFSRYSITSPASPRTPLKASAPATALRTNGSTACGILRVAVCASNSRAAWPSESLRGLKRAPSWCRVTRIVPTGRGFRPTRSSGNSWSNPA